MSSVEPGQMLQKTMSALRDRDGQGADNADAKAAKSAYSSIGVVVVTYNSADVIESCLSSLLASRDVDIRIAICDNGSTDGTQEIVRDVTAAAKLKLAEMNVADLDKAQRPPRVSLVHSDANRGYAGGVNLGLRLFLNAPRVGLFWVLNPDSEVRTDTRLSTSSPCHHRIARPRVDHDTAFARPSGRNRQPLAPGSNIPWPCQVALHCLDSAPRTAQRGARSETAATPD